MQLRPFMKEIIDALSEHAAARKWLFANPAALGWIQANRTHILRDRNCLVQLARNRNPRAIEFLVEFATENDMDLVDSAAWPWLCANPAAIEYVTDRANNGVRVDWTIHGVSTAASLWQGYALCANPAAMHLITASTPPRDTPEFSNGWHELSHNPSAMDLIEAEVNEPDSKVNWLLLGSNTAAGQFLYDIERRHNDLLEQDRREGKRQRRENPIVWSRISKNPGAIDLIRYKLNSTRPEGIDWLGLAENPMAVDLLGNFPYDNTTHTKNMICALARNVSSEAMYFLKDIVQRKDPATLWVAWFDPDKSHDANWDNLKPMILGLCGNPIPDALDLVESEFPMFIDDIKHYLTSSLAWYDAAGENKLLTNPALFVQDDMGVILK